MKKGFKRIVAFILVFAFAISLCPTKASAIADNKKVTAEKLNNSASQFINYAQNKYNTNNNSKYDIGNITNVVATASTVSGSTVTPGTITITFRSNNQDYPVVINWWDYSNASGRPYVVLAVNKVVTNTATEDEMAAFEEYLTCVVYGYVLVSMIEGGNLDTTLPYFVNTMNLELMKNPGTGLVINSDGSFSYDSDWMIRDNIESYMINSYQYYRQYAQASENSLQVQNEMIVFLDSNFANISDANSAAENDIKKKEDEAKKAEEDAKKAEEEAKKKAEEEAKKKMSGDTTDGSNSSNSSNSAEKKTEENPKTGFSLPITIMLFGTAMVVIIALVTKKKKKLMKI